MRSFCFPSKFFVFTYEPYLSILIFYVPVPNSNKLFNCRFRGCRQVGKIIKQEYIQLFRRQIPT